MKEPVVRKSQIHEASLLDTSLFVKYSASVYIVTLRHLQEAQSKYPDAAAEIRAWATIVGNVRWHNFNEVKETFTDADSVDGYVIFNIRRNRYRLITVLHYAKTGAKVPTQGHAYIRSFLTHKQYDNRSNWDKEYGS